MAAVVDPGIQMPGCEAVQPSREGRSDEPNVGSADLLGEPGPFRELETLLELLPIPLAAADRGTGEGGDSLVVEVLRELERTLGPLDCLLAPACAGVGICEVFICHRELPPRRQSLEERDRLASRPCGFHGPAGAPEDLREPPQRVALLEPLPESPTALERVLDRLDRRVVLVAQVAGVGPSLEELRPLGG